MQGTHNEPVRDDVLRATEELEAARDEFEDLFASIRSILISVDAEGVVRRWSELAAKTFGISAEDALGAPFRNLTIDWDWNAVEHAAEVSRSAMLPARVDDLEFVTGGNVRLLGLTVSPSKRGGFLVMGADVTNRKVEERLLMERERFYRSIVDNIQDVIFETDVHGHWTFLNPAFERFFGVSVNVAAGQSAFEIVPCHDRRKAIGHLAALLRYQANDTRFETRYRRPDGTMGWAEVHVEAQFDDEGKLAGTFGTIREISERKRNEDLEKRLSDQLLRATEDRVKTIIESAPIMVFSLDREGVLTFIDGKAIETLGRTAAELEGLNMFDMVQERPDIAAIIRQALSGEPVTAEIQTGDVFLEVRYSPVFDAEGRPDGATGVAIDITESKRLESQLVHARKMESIGHLAAGLAHEVNTPTQYIADNTRFLRDSFNPIAETLRYARTLVESADPVAAHGLSSRWKQEDIDYLLEEIPAALSQSLEGLARVSQIVRSMKQFSHPGTRNRQWADINEQMLSTITVSRNEWKYVAEVETDFDPELPQAWCLPAELNQVFLNMIVNASHSISDCVDEGKYELGLIKISTRKVSDSMIEISIQDNARGIPAHIREKIFDPFFTTKDPGKGTGQGLALAHTVVIEQHEGEISVESEPGVGTRFNIRIPIGAGNEMPIMQKEAA